MSKLSISALQVVTEEVDSQFNQGHAWSPWYGKPDYDVYRRACAKCPQAMEFTGQFLEAIQDKEQLIVALIQTAYTIPPCVGYSGVKPHPDFDKYYDLFGQKKIGAMKLAASESGLKSNQKAMDEQLVKDKELANAIKLLAKHGMVTYEDALALVDPEKPSDFEQTGLEKIIAASESNGPYPNNWTSWDKELIQKDESVLAQNLPDPPVGTSAPYQLVEPPDIPDEVLSAIIEWLELSRDQCESPSHWLSLQVVIDVPNIVLGYEITEGATINNSSFDTVSLNYYQVLIRRTFVILADSRWFMEVAIRQDTGEPVATVNHSGEFGHWMAQQSNY